MITEQSQVTLIDDAPSVLAQETLPNDPNAYSNITNAAQMFTVPTPISHPKLAIFAI